MKSVEVRKFGHVPWMILATVAFSIMSLLVKRLSGALNGLEIVFYRSLSHLIILLPLLFLTRTNPLRDISPALLLRSLFGFLGVAFYFSSLGRMEAGVASLIQWTAPAFTFLYAILILGEKVPGRSLLLLMTAFLGLGLATVHPSGIWGVTPLAAALGFCGALFAGVSYGLLKSIARKANPETLAVWMSVVSLVGALLGTGGNIRFLEPSALLCAVGIGLMVSLYQFSVTKAYQNAPAVRVAPLSLAPGIMVLLFDSLLHHTIPEAQLIVGSTITVASLAFLVG